MPRKFSEYFNGQLVRFVELDGQLYVDTDDFHLLFEQPTLH